METNGSRPRVPRAIDPNQGEPSPRERELMQALAQARQMLSQRGGGVPPVLGRMGLEKPTSDITVHLEGGETLQIRGSQMGVSVIAVAPTSALLTVEAPGVTRAINWNKVVHFEATESKIIEPGK